jgi:hypothetical protein
LKGSDAATLEYVEEELTAVEAAFTVNLIPQSNGFATEDCLFLDVIVPESIYNSKSSAPVLVWVYGGGCMFNSILVWYFFREWTPLEICFEQRVSQLQ